MEGIGEVGEVIVKIGKVFVKGILGEGEKLRGRYVNVILLDERRDVGGGKFGIWRVGVGVVWIN
ncbi:hypothetical protein ACRFB9_28040 [Klebsiella pneumoniae]